MSATSPSLHRWVSRVLVAALAFFPAARSYAVMGGVIILADETDWYKWPRELQQWQTLIGESRVQVQRTNDVIARLRELIDRADRRIKVTGDPAKAVRTFVGSVPDVMKPVQAAADLETTKHALDSGRNLFSPGSKGIRAYNPAKKLERTYDAFGKTYERREGRYGSFAMHEAMYARYRTAATNQEDVQKHELALQRGALDKLKAAATETEVAAFSADIAASHQRQDLAHQRAMQAKADLDAYHVGLRLESERKAEADREWAETIVARLQEKALAGYRAQLGDGTSTR